MSHFIKECIGVIQATFPDHMALNTFLIMLNLALGSYLLYALGVFSRKKTIRAGDTIAQFGMAVKSKQNDERS